MLSLFTSLTSEILEESIIKKKTDLENLSFFFKGFLIFALHCERNSQVSFIWKKDCVEQEFQNLAWIWVPFLTRELRACARASYSYDVGNSIRSLARSLARSIGRFL